MFFNLNPDSVQVDCLLPSYFSRSCFELLLSIPESELPPEVWLGFHQSIQVSVLIFSYLCNFLCKKKGCCWASLLLSFHHSTATSPVLHYCSLSSRNFWGAEDFSTPSVQAAHQQVFNYAVKGPSSKTTIADLGLPNDFCGRKAEWDGVMDQFWRITLEMTIVIYCGDLSGKLGSVPNLRGIEIVGQDFSLLRWCWNKLVILLLLHSHEAGC